jgi:hypothetical protein
VPDHRIVARTIVCLRTATQIASDFGSSNIACKLCMFLVAEYLQTRQTELLSSLLTTVKHELNNDMQVVVVNAELAEILMKSGGDVIRTVSNIVKAASAANICINQLSVFNATNQVVKTTVDLNLLLRQCASQLREKLPHNANFRLELDRLPG